jgi:glutamine synthetase
MSRYEYIWIDGGGNLRSKTRFVSVPLAPPEKWNYDGSSTGQAPGNDSEVTLSPVAIFNDPFGDISRDRLVLCETHTSDDKPAKWNNRSAIRANIDACHSQHDLWFGFEMEYFLMDAQTHKPLGWPPGGSRPPPQGQFYCGVGAHAAHGRHIKDEHASMCQKAGLTVAGTNGEVAPGQWEIQIGIVHGINAADQLWVARYILQRVAEKYGAYASFDPKIDPGYNGSGLHTNVSTKQTRAEGTGIQFIEDSMQTFEKLHPAHMRQYGAGNERRMTGEHETASFERFSYGVADRGASIRIPRTTAAAGCGYFEDRRPASNADPYVVIKCIAEALYLSSAAVARDECDH